MPLSRRPGGLSADKRPERAGYSCPRPVSESALHQPERNAGKEQGDDVGQKKRPAAVVITDIGEAPEVSEADCRPYPGEYEGEP